MNVARTAVPRLFAGVVILAGSVCISIAQDTTKSTVTQGEKSVTTQVERAEVVYVSGNELVVRTESGEVRHLTVPAGATAVVDGKQLTVRDLKPGMKLQRTITTTSIPTTVTTVRTVSGTVVQVIPPLTVVLRLGDGGNKQYKIPEDQVFVVDGIKRTAFDLRPGMPISATVVTTTPSVQTAEQRVVTGTAPPPPPPRPATPPPQPVLLIEAPAPAPVPVAAATPARPPQQRAPEPAPTTLPKTASPLPLIGLLGLVLFSASLGLRAVRR